MPTMLERIAWKRKKWSENGEAWSELVDLLFSPELEAELNELADLREAVRWMHRNAIGWRTEFPKSIRDAAEAALKGTR